MMYRKPVCVPCHLEYKTKVTGILLVDIASFGPHKFTFADLLECPKCKHQIVWGYGDHPTYHTEEGFHTTLGSYKRKNLYIECRG